MINEIKAILDEYAASPSLQKHLDLVINDELTDVNSTPNGCDDLIQFIYDLRILLHDLATGRQPMGGLLDGLSDAADAAVAMSREWMDAANAKPEPALVECDECPAPICRCCYGAGFVLDDDNRRSACGGCLGTGRDEMAGQ